MRETIYESEKMTVWFQEKNNVHEYFRQFKDPKNSEEIEIYKIYEDKIVYHFDGVSISKITIIGKNEIPACLSKYGFGFSEKYVNYYFKNKVESDLFSELVIYDDNPKIENKKIYVNEEQIDQLINSINQEFRAFNDTKRILVNNYFAENYPDFNLNVKETNNNKALILRNLNKKLIDKLTANDIEKIGQFYVEATQKFTRQDIVMKIMLNMQKNAQQISLQELIKIYETNLKDNPAESVWQDYFNKYITLFDNRYVSKINYKNIATGITKYPDLVLIDIYGYLDFYELKKSGMKLLQYDDSHKNYYWSKELSMTISQVSDYIQKSKENALSYSKSIFDETSVITGEGLHVNIINPKGIIVAGTSTELSNEKMKNCFKNLRESLKDIEFVLYDELLDRLKNLLQAIKV